MWKGSRVNPTFLSWWQIFWVDFLSKRLKSRKKKSSWAHSFAFPTGTLGHTPPSIAREVQKGSQPEFLVLSWSPTQACLHGGCPETSLKMAENQSSSIREDCSFQMRVRERSCPAARVAQYIQQTKVEGESVLGIILTFQSKLLKPWWQPKLHKKATKPSNGRSQLIIALLRYNWCTVNYTHLKAQSDKFWHILWTANMRQRACPSPQSLLTPSSDPSLCLSPRLAPYQAPSCVPR